MTKVRLQSLARAIYGLALLCRPRLVLELSDAPPDGRAPVTVARVLGARHLLQAAVTIAIPDRRVVLLGVVADGLHAASDIGVATVDRRWRQAALIDSVLAASFAAAGIEEWLHRRNPG